MLVRPPFTFWDGERLPLKRIGEIVIKHPFYHADGDGYFLMLPACDPTTAGQHKRPQTASTTGPSRTREKLWGIHRGTVTLGCAVLAGNKYGVLSPTVLTGEDELRGMIEAAKDAYDEVLCGRCYYYYTCW
ncbi:hypothetical protein Dda_6412 [Drechslerella dactyloides]|uniref:Uncharacterized protein n=1 Tax=Drechslerella dactyloides TaxID=74499 RepID=A0AAD6IXS8_DREDA|nr:hypothetical protein Dda_6412 [Drechslerella dactyloides]